MAADGPAGRAFTSANIRVERAPGGGVGVQAGRVDAGPVLDVYARLSKAHNGETVQVDDQVELCVDKIADRGGRVGEVFRDNSLSAWKPGVVREQWNLLMARLEAGATDGVMVYDLTRFSRKVIEGERLVELAERGVRVWALSGEYDLTTADGRRHFREMMVAAAGESDKMSERVKRGKLRRARKGRSHGGGRAYAMPGRAPAPVGWEPGDPRPAETDARVEAEREVVRECYRRLLAGDSVTAIVTDLNKRGTGTGAATGPSGSASQGASDASAVVGASGGGVGERVRAVLPVSGAPWRRGVFVRSMSRAALAGLLEHNGAVVGELAGVEPVVSREEWERVVALFAARRTGRPASARHLLSGLIVCAACGNTLLGFPRNSLPPYPDGEPKREYRCRPRGDHPGEGRCGRNHIDGRTADQAVDAAIIARLGDPRRADRVAAHLSASRAQRAEIEGELSRLEASADQVVTKTAAWGVERVDAAMTPILARIRALRESLAGLDEPESVEAATADAVAAWATARDGGDIPAMRALIRRAFPRLALAMPARWGDHSPHRFHWDGTANFSAADADAGG